MRIPTAIALAGLFIGLGLYFGLRGRPAERPAGAAPEVARAAIASPPVSPPAVVKQNAVAALELQRPALLAKCWQPAVSAQPLPSAVEYTFDFTFDADGNQVARGLRESRTASRPDVTPCVTQTLVPLKIPAPGATSAVDVKFRLP